MSKANRVQNESNTRASARFTVSGTRTAGFSVWDNEPVRRTKKLLVPSDQICNELDQKSAENIAHRLNKLCGREIADDRSFIDRNGKLWFAGKKRKANETFHVLIASVRDVQSTLKAPLYAHGQFVGHPRLVHSQVELHCDVRATVASYDFWTAIGELIEETKGFPKSAHRFQWRSSRRGSLTRRKGGSATAPTKQSPSMAVTLAWNVDGVSKSKRDALVNKLKKRFEALSKLPHDRVCLSARRLQRPPSLDTLMGGTL
jgi:hypothetical protein